MLSVRAPPLAWEASTPAGRLQPGNLRLGKKPGARELAGAGPPDPIASFDRDTSL